MKYYKLHICSYSNWVCLVLMCFLLFYNGKLQSQTEKKKKQNFELKVRLASIYDDNILKYSNKYLERFMYGLDEGRFHINTYDDAIIFTSLGLTWTFKIFGNKKSKINGDVSRRSYIVNDIKSWNYFTIGFRQYFAKKASFKILYSFIPDFYVRHFRDEQWVFLFGNTTRTFQPYVFSKDNYGFWIQNTFFKNSRVKFSLYYSTYYHNERYTEFDSKNFTYSFQLYQRIHKKVRIDIGYQYITSDAKGYDSSVETPETTNGPDATYVEDRFLFGIVWQPPRIAKRKHSLEGKMGLFKRYYSSSHPWQIDRLHAGRVDENLRFYVYYKLKLNKSWQLTAYYNWFRRKSDTSALLNKRFVSNEKDYRQNIIGLEVTYALKF